jgi:hypothetical protein
MDGKPFFLVNQAVDPGLLQTLEHDIVPRLERDVPNQPNAEELEADPLLRRFTIVFDREGYSPNFFERMKARHVACLSYCKRPGEDWPPEEFIPTDIRLPSGERTTSLLAERGTRLSNGMWVPNSASCPKADTRPRLSPPITGVSRHVWPHACSLDGLKKTSSGICAKTTIWMGLSTMYRRHS